ncbi:hypothetical protein ACTRXD_05420 [Nitrospira sp. T9]|uniref:hypothetical protein n=1 Tax=unclassified Nitrospira TaxID=2652172 RepID=UPI003F9B9017
MVQIEQDALRKHLRTLLEQGLQTELEPRAYTSEDINHLVHRLKSLRPDDYERKLQIAGFQLDPYRPQEEMDEEIVQSCETCMYYVVHQQYCELPELAIPVEKDWSCRLWRI